MGETSASWAPRGPGQRRDVAGSGHSVRYSSYFLSRRRIERYEAMHMIRKGQVRWLSGDDVRRQIQFIQKLFELPA
jgi:hypothetical protein